MRFSVDIGFRQDSSTAQPSQDPVYRDACAAELEAGADGDFLGSAGLSGRRLEVACAEDPERQAMNELIVEATGADERGAKEWLEPRSQERSHGSSGLVGFRRCAGARQG